MTLQDPQDLQEEALSPRMAAIGGHYIITIGMTGSGKTTFQNFLIRYLIEGTDDFIVKAFENNEASEAIIRHWKARWKTGDLELPTALGPPKEYVFDIAPSPQSRYKHPLTFAFFEVSGEDLGQVMYQEGGQQILPPVFLKILNHPNAKYVIVLVSDGAKLRKDDDFFFDFLQYLDRNLLAESKALLHEENRLLLLISKPQEAEHKLFSKISDSKPGRDPASVQIVRHYLRQTYREIQGWGVKPAVGSLYIGKLESVQQDGTGTPVQKLFKPDFKEIGDVFHWFYCQVTGAPLGPTLIGRVRKSFASMFR